MICKKIGTTTFDWKEYKLFDINFLGELVENQNIRN